MENVPQLSTPEEELAYLRSQIVAKEKQVAALRISGEAGQPMQVEIIKEHLAAHKAAPPEAILKPEFQMSDVESDSKAAHILRELSLGNDEQAIVNLQKIMETK